MSTGRALKSPFIKPCLIASSLNFLQGNGDAAPLANFPICQKKRTKTKKDHPFDVTHLMGLAWGKRTTPTNASLREKARVSKVTNQIIKESIGFIPR